uniref:Ubiquinone biosynthesis O-methyltransferase, mitochondrial n=1 Tax=Soboliphyme baturini TaxID=241478 RepID=A0A183IT35_9BILA
LLFCKNYFQCYSYFRVRYIPTLNDDYRLGYSDRQVKDAIRAQISKHAHIRDPRVIDILAHRAEIELEEVKFSATPSHTLYNVLFPENLCPKPTDFLSNTIDDKNLSRFRELCNEWWKEDGVFRLLLSMNQLRIPWIRENVMLHRLKTVSFDSERAPLRGVSILDVGCGGGFLSEALARIGATVTGLDAEEQNIQVARIHQTFDKSIEKNLNYVCGTVEKFLTEGIERFDVLVASEVVEHVNHVPQFVKSCIDIVKPGGLLFFTTINRTFLSWLLGIQVAEKVLSLVPKGVHEWKKFVPPDDLRSLLESNNCKVQMISGMLPNPFTNHWCWTKLQEVNYALYAIKNNP